MSKQLISDKEVSEATWHWDVSNDLLSLTERFCECVGHRPDGHPVRFEFLCTLIHPDDLPLFRAAVLASLKGTGTPFSLELRTMTRWGEARTQRMSGEVSRRSVTGLALEVAGRLQD